MKYYITFSNNYNYQFEKRRMLFDELNDYLDKLKKPNYCPKLYFHEKFWTTINTFDIDVEDSNLLTYLSLKYDAKFIEDIDSNQ